MHRRIIVIGFVTLLAEIGWAQNPSRPSDRSPLTLAGAIAQAQAQNPDLRVLAAQRESLLARKARALGPNPLAIGVTRDFNGTRQYELSQRLGVPGKSFPVAASLSAEAEAVDYERQAKELEIAREVKTAFYRLWISNRQLSVNDLRRSSFEKILAVARRRFVKNTTTEVEFLNARTLLFEVDNERADLLAAETAARTSIGILLGRSAGDPLKIQEPLPPFFPFRADRTTLRARLLAGNPALKASQAGIQAAGHRVSAAAYSAWPDIQMKGGRDNESNYLAGIQLTVPVWYAFNERLAVRAARQDRLGQEARVDALQRDLVAAMQGHVSRLEALGSKLDNYSKNIILTAEKAFELALRNYGYGKIDYNTLAGSANTFVNARMGYERLLEEYATELAQLEVLIGGPLP